MTSELKTELDKARENHSRVIEAHEREEAHLKAVVARKGYTPAWVEKDLEKSKAKVRASLRKLDDAIAFHAS